MSKYDSYAPSADKFINSDGSVVELVNGTIVEPANPTRAELYKTYQPKANKFLKSDGSIVELDSIGGGGTIEIPLKGSGTTAEMNAVTDAVDGDFWLNTDTSTIWKYTAGTWNDTGVGLGVDLSMYQIPKLTSNTGYKRKDITNDTELLEAYGSVSINAGYMNTLAQANGVQYDTDADGQALGFVNRSNDNPGLLTTVVQTTKTHRSFALTVWTTIGSVKIKELGNNLGTVVGSDAGIIELYGKSGIFTVSGNYPIVEGVMFGAVSGTITMPDDVTNKSVVTITDITGKSAVTSFGGTDTEITWTKAGETKKILEMAYIQEGSDNWAIAKGTITTTSELWALNHEIGYYEAENFDIDGTQYNGVIELKAEVANAAKICEFVTYTGEIFTCRISGSGYAEPWRKVGNVDLSNYYTKAESDNKFLSATSVENFQQYKLTADNGAALGVINSEEDLLNLTNDGKIGIYEKNNTWSILGDNAFGVVEILPYGIIEPSVQTVIKVTTEDGIVYVTNKSIGTITLNWIKVGGYDLVKPDGTNLVEITSDTVLFTSPVGRYDKGTYSIGGNSSSGMIEIYDYGNTSGYKKANAFFSDEIWTCTFKSTGFSGEGWKKIAEVIKPYFSNTTVTTAKTLGTTPTILTTIDTDVNVHARAYLTALVSRTGGTSAVGVVTVILSDGTTTLTFDYDIGRDLSSTVNLNTAKRLYLQAGTITIYASYTGTGTVTVNNISASIE